MKRWKADRGAAVEVECEEAGYPHLDADGETQFDNTHFDTEAEAWESARADAEARISLAGSEVERLEGALRRAQEEAAEAAKMWVRHTNLRRLSERAE